VGTLSQLRYKGVVSSNTNTTLKKADEDADDVLVGNDFCGDPATLQSETNCGDLIDMNKLNDDYEKLCTNKESCKINLASYATTDADKLKALPE